ncbi:MAG TPA: hopanoid biosynthesis associated radical SAM protein HpnJ [Bryobacterales bacterium]|jgi:hopanoid biosynthesis associated radical SAM protein HpnJ|nr:hopanoid biosynthesis associated radical SAM protein HpnJ [Bryobacterales bacterium]
MRTLFLNPPSFEGFDGGASSRWPATREIESYWYPVWLCYPAGMLPDSKVVDAPPHKISVRQTIEMAKDFEFLVLFTSTPGFHSDVRMAEMMQDANPRLKIAFVGPHVSVLPEESLKASKAIHFVVRGEFDHPIVDFANGKPLEEIPGVSFRQNGGFRHNPEGPKIEDLDSLPWVTKVYKRDFDITRYNVPFLLNPYLSFFTERGCPALCTFCLWPQTLSGHPWRTRSANDVANEVRFALENFPGLKEIFFDDDTFNIRKSRVLELCEKLKPLKFTWSCTSRVTVDYETLKAMKDAGCRLLIVGYESGDPQILKNIKKGATVERAIEFTRDCKKLGLVIHGDFIIGLPGETRESINATIEFAKRLDTETIQVSIAHAYPGTEFYEYVKKNDLITIDSMTDDTGHQLPNVIYPGLDRGELVDAVERFYGEFYFRPKVVWRIVRKALFNGAERRRLAKEAREYLALRAKRKKFVLDQRQVQPPQPRPIPAAPAGD